MKLTFRQGIARHQNDVNGNPTFLQRSGNYVDLVVSPEPAVLLFAHHAATYIVEELKSVTHAWGPFTGAGTKYLFWDIDLLTGILTRGFTLYAVMVTSSAPVSPAVDQHWFDTVENVMRVWNGKKWQEKIRVFAGYVTSNTLIHPYSVGSQCGLNGAFEGGYILLDSFGAPLRQSDGTLLTTAAWLNVVNLGTVTARVDQAIMGGMADEELPMFSLVSIRPGRRLILSRSTDLNTRIAGIVMEDLYQGDVSIIVSTGVVRNQGWSWPPLSMNRPVFCGPTGQVTLTPPTQGVLQQVGFVYDTDAIHVQIHQPVILDDPANTIVPPPPPPVGSPIANFTLGPTTLIQGNTPITGVAPFDVYFTNTSVGATSVEWDFINDGFTDSTVPNPMYTYSAPGTYTVRQKAINGFGFDEEIKSNIVIVTAPNTGPLDVNLGLSFGAPAQVIGGATFSFQVIVSNDGSANATNVQRILKLRSSNGSKVTIVSPPVGVTVTYSGPITNVTLPLVGINSGAFVALTLQASTETTATAMQLEGNVTSPETDPTQGDNSASLTITVKP